MPRVSVIIPTYNCAHYLGQAIESVLSQTYTDLEILVIDDGSRDNTADVAARYGSRIRYLRQENRGLPAARNAAIQASGSALIALLDADDWWEPTKLEKQMAVLDRQDQIGLVYTDLKVIYDDGAVIPSFLASRPLAKDGYVFEALIESAFILPSTVLLRRSCLDEVGLFDETMRSHEDIELWLRLCHRWKVAGVREPLVNRRQGAQNMTANPALRAEYGVKTFQKALTISDLTAGQRLALQRKLRTAYFELAYYFFEVGDGRSCRQSLAKSLDQGQWDARARRFYLLSLLPRGVVSLARRSLRPQQGS